MEFAVQMFLWLVTYSVLGWAYESLLCSARERRWVNRGFLNGPYCPIYGIGAVAVVLAFEGRIENPIALFFAGAILTCTLEYVTSWAMERLFAARWWDYSNRRFNLNGRVCLEGFVVFGLLSVWLLKVTHPQVAVWTQQLAPAARNWLAGWLLILLIADFLVTVRHIRWVGTALAELQRQIERLIEAAEQKGEQWILGASELLPDRAWFSDFYAERAADWVRLGRYQTRRLARAFPRLRSLRYAEALELIKKALKTDRKS